MLSLLQFQFFGLKNVPKGNILNVLVEGDIFLLMKYKWQLRQQENISDDFLAAAGGSLVIAKLLLNRGINLVEKAKAYLNPRFYTESSPSEIPDLLKARDRILDAVRKKEKITIFGDYDVDGVTATSCLLITLRQFTDKVDFYIPNRLLEGYGLNSDAVKTIAKKHKTKLLITCDCGITNHKEIELANELGMNVIVTDHHSLPEILPPACAVLNPKQLPSDHKLHFLPGVGVAYKLCEALLEVATEKDKFSKEDLLDLVTLGMIADIVPLVDENRYLVQLGLEKLVRTKKVGLRELLRICGVKCPDSENTSNGKSTNDAGQTVEYIGFGIAPRINAVGRLADASMAVKLLTTENLLEAIHISSELDMQNRQRQFICEETLKEAVELYEEQKSTEPHNKSIVLAKKGWHHGVVGIVASRLVEKFSLPVLLMTLDEEQEMVKGSGRSIEHLNITEMLGRCAHHLEKFGGHKAACGLSLKSDKLDDFICEFKNIVNNHLDGFNLEPVLNIDMELPLTSVNSDLINKINMLAPFGLGNSVPIFSSEEVKIAGIRNIGKNGNHLKLVLAPSKEPSDASRNNKAFLLEALIWNYDSTKELNIGDTGSVAYTPKINLYNGEKFIQLEIKDWCLSKTRNIKIKESYSKTKLIKLFDFRGRDSECLEIFKPFNKNTCVCFAEIQQKNYQPYFTCSRNRVYPVHDLVFLEPPPDKNVFLEVITLSTPFNIYLAFPSTYSDYLYPADVLKRLSGMLRYAVNNMGGKLEEHNLTSALGLTKVALIYALEILVRSGFLSYKRINNELSINISSPSRQNFEELIEYNLLETELRQISAFRSWITDIGIEGIKSLLKENNLNSEVELNIKARVVL